MLKNNKHPLANLQQTLLALALATTLIGAPPLNAADTMPPPSDFIIYEVQPGDTLRSIAETHMGGAEYILELMEYNEIANPGSIGPTSIISIPTHIRATTLQEIKKAEEALAESIDVMAEQFAKDDYLQAINTMESARNSRAQARYDQAIAFARLTTVNARLAKEAALRNAIAQLSVTLQHLSGTVEISTDAGTTWHPAATNQKIIAPARIRTSTNSVAILLLEDASTIQINPQSTFAITQLTLDRRTKQRQTKLRVLLGEIIGNITPQNKDNKGKSTFEFKSQETSIAIRGTTLRIQAENNHTTRIAMYDGTSIVTANKKSRAIEKGFGSIIHQGQKPSRPIKLPPTPTLHTPHGTTFTTFDPHVPFTWKRVKNRWAVPSYKLEITQDPTFFNLTHTQTTSAKHYTTQALKPGHYHARLTAINKQNLSSQPSNIITFHVKKDTAIHIKDLLDPIIIDDKPFVMANHGFALQANNTPNSLSHITYTINDAPEKTYRKPLHFTTEGQHLITAWGIGKDNSKSKPITRNIIVDLSPPTVKAGYQFFRKRELREPIALVQITAEDQAGVKYSEYSLNGGPFITYVTPFEVSLFDNTKMKYRATDELGQTSYTYETIIPGQKVTH